jgi:hypothetical protein
VTNPDHPDHDALLDAALDPDPEVEQHLRDCGSCLAEVRELRSLVQTARAPDPLPVQAAPSHVWDAIRDELGDELVSTRPDDAAARAATVTLLPVAPPAGDPQEAAPGTEPDRTPARTLGGRRRSRVWWAAAAAVAVAASVVGAVAWSSRPTDGTVLASTTLLALEGGADHGTAQVDQVDGARVLRVTTDGVPQPRDGFLEVWLLDESASRLVPLGILTASEGTFPLPPDLDLGEYPVVDVSDEPLDGDPSHSCDSLVRGTLQL